MNKQLLSIKSKVVMLVGEDVTGVDDETLLVNLKVKMFNLITDNNIYYLEELISKKECLLLNSKYLKILKLIYNYN